MKPYVTPEDLGLSISNKAKPQADLAPQLQVDETYAEMLKQPAMSEAKRLDNWIPKKAEATESEIKQLKDSWSKILGKHGAFQDIADQTIGFGAKLFSPLDGPLAKGTELYERFMREAARRSDFINYPQEA